MADTTVSVRSDSEILEDVDRLIRDSFSLSSSRGHYRYAVHNGVITVKGNISSRIGYEWFVGNLTALDGVMALDDRELYDDETLRIKIAEVLPQGMRVRVKYGVVALVGQMSVNDPAAQEAIARVGEMRGVVSLVINGLRG